MTSNSKIPVGERLLTIEGASNFRDAGGYSTASGAKAKAKRLYRSAQLGSVTASGARAMSELGIKTIIDLRGPRERLTAPSAFAEGMGMKVVSCPIVPGSRDSIRGNDGYRSISADELRATMKAVYQKLVRDEKTAVGAGLRAVLEAAPHPFVVHCTAGKDRTGLVVALILSLLGVSRETIFEDYLLTNVHWNRAAVGYDDMPADALSIMLAAEREYLAASFSALDADYESFATFVVSATGMKDYPERLKELLLD